MNNIHPTAIVDSRVQLGANNVILPYCVLIGPLELGDNNIIGPHVVIGSPGADTRQPRYNSTDKLVKIGSNNIIREFSAVQKPCYTDLTEIGNDTYLMQGVNVSHDVKIADKVTLTASVALAGMAKILKGASLGMGVSVNQRNVIGQYSMTASGAAAMKSVLPFAKYIPGKPLSVNSYAIEKFGFQAFRGEIENFVLNRERPYSSVILNIIEEYEKACLDYETSYY
jgi:UDP-N-acetylglucosamine acyltransferase